MERALAIKKISEKFGISEVEIIQVLENSSQTTTQLPKEKNPKIKNLPVFFKKRESVSIAVVRKKYYFLKKDYDLLLLKFEDILQEIERLGLEIGGSCDETETFHDNFDYEECGRQQRMWIAHYRKFKKVKEGAEIVQEKMDLNFVNIGRTVVIKFKNGKELTKKIGSYMTFSDDEISYNAPLAKVMIGKKIGDNIQEKYHNHNFQFQIISIS